MGNRRNIRGRRIQEEHPSGEADRFEVESRLPAEKSPATSSCEHLDPEVRPEKVARGRRLVRDEKYPPKEVIDSVAELLARHLDSDSTR